MKEVNINIVKRTFPSQFVSDEEKALPEFGLKVGQAIQHEWFRRDGGSCRFYNQLGQYHKLRLYARGEQPVGKYKNELAIDGDLSYLNLDWTPVPIIPKFVDIVVNGMSSRYFDVKAYAQDPVSSERRNQFKDMVEADMAARELLLQVKEDFGVETFNIPEEELPGSDEELSIYMQLNYKPAVEMTAEEAIKTVLLDNDYEDIRRRLDYDLTVLGKAIVKHEFNPGDGVSIKYVDPANVIHSYTEDPHFQDCFYWGEVKTVPITELIKINPSLGPEDLEKISKYSQSWYDYYNVTQFYNDDVFKRDTATLLYFNYKTTNTFKYKKKVSDNGIEKVIEKPSSFNPPQEMVDEGRFEVIEKTIDVWYEGVMVMGTDIVLRWNLMQNMVRPKSASQKAMPNYVCVAPRLYKGNVESLVRRMIPFADLIQITHLKLQQVMNRMTPDGVFIDADGLNEVDLGTGAAYNPEDALRLYFQTGSVVGRSYTQDGEFNNARVPIQPISGHSGQGKMSSLIGSYNYYLDMIRSVTGLNEARDGSTPDPNALVGVQKMAALNSNTATRHILDGSLSIIKRLSESLMLRISDILEYAPFREEFAMQIGKHSVSMLEDIQDLYLSDFGIFISIAPDEEQRAMLEQNIQIALSSGDITLEDAIDIREIKNIKLANQVIKIRRAVREKNRQNPEIMKLQMNQQGQMQSQQLAGEIAAQKMQIQSQLNMQEEQAKLQLEMQKMQAEAELKSKLMAEQFEYDMQLKGKDDENLRSRDDAKEKAKDKRVDRQNTQQSQLIDQRKRDLPPKDFEKQKEVEETPQAPTPAQSMLSAMNQADGFDFRQFGPR